MQTEKTAPLNTIDGFEKAEYEKFNSPAKDNGLYGTPLYFDGTVGEVRNLFADQSQPFSNYLYLSVNQADGKEWLLEFEPEPATKRDVLESLSGKKVRVFCVYIGLSIEYEKPVGSLYYTSPSCKILDSENDTEITYKDVINDVEPVVKWCDNNAKELCVDDFDDIDNQGKFFISTGVVESVSSEEHYLSIFAGNSSGSLSIYKFDVSKPYLRYSVNLNGLQFGDYIKVYYILGGDNVPYVFAVIKTADNGNTLLSKEYKAYSYNEIARNPNKVKGNKAMVSGKVIQVLEDGETVNLRVNITNSGGRYSDTVLVVYTRKNPDEDRILENDIVTVYGTLEGLYTYDSTFGSKVTVPLVDADYVDIDM